MSKIGAWWWVGGWVGGGRRGGEGGRREGSGVRESEWCRGGKERRGVGGWVGVVFWFGILTLAAWFPGLFEVF